VWLAMVGSERIDETTDPELSIDRAIQNYRCLWQRVIENKNTPAQKKPRPDWPARLSTNYPRGNYHDET